MSLLADIQLEKVPTKRRYIYQTLRHQILARQLVPGTLVPSATELARHFGVSYVTAHSALNDLVRDGLLLRHQGKGTFTANTRAEKKRPLTSNLVMVLPVQEDIDASGSADEVLKYLQGCTQGARSCGADFAVISIPSFLKSDGIQSTLQQLLRYDGALFLETQYKELIEELHRRNFPCVIVGREPCPASHVRYDFEEAVELGVKHLLGHGYRRIGFFGRTLGEMGVKFRVFSRFLEANGIPLSPSWVQECTLVDEAYRAAKRFLGVSPLPEAVFVDNHHKAHMLLSVAREHGFKVPGDIAVTGYGADITGTSATRLTMVLLPYEAMGQEGVRQLDKLVRGSVAPPVEKILKARLMIRASCGCTTAEANRAE